MSIIQKHRDNKIKMMDIYHFTEPIKYNNKMIISESHIKVKAEKYDTICDILTRNIPDTFENRLCCELYPVKHGIKNPVACLACKRLLLRKEIMKQPLTFVTLAINTGYKRKTAITCTISSKSINHLTQNESINTYDYIVYQLLKKYAKQYVYIIWNREKKEHPISYLWYYMLYQIDLAVCSITFQLKYKE